MEQDIFFTKKIDIDEKIPILINLESDYLSIYDFNKNKLYPRIWEGATFIKKNLILDALSDNVTLGSHNANYIKNNEFFLKNFKTTPSRIDKEFITIKEYLNRDFFDTLFEFGCYCFIKKIPYVSFSKMNYEMNDHVVHLRGIDMMCHDKPSIYENLEDTLCVLPEGHPCSQVWKKSLNDCSLMLLLCGVHGKSDLMKSNLKNNFQNSKYLVESKIKKMLGCCGEWMTKEEQKKLIWAYNLIKEKCLM